MDSNSDEQQETRPQDRDGWCSRTSTRVAFEQGCHDALQHLFGDYCSKCGPLDRRDVA